MIFMSARYADIPTLMRPRMMGLAVLLTIYAPAAGRSLGMMTR